jgi:hypothetical protein
LAGNPIRPPVQRKLSSLSMEGAVWLCSEKQP